MRSVVAETRAPDRAELLASFVKLVTEGHVDEALAMMDAALVHLDAHNRRLLLENARLRKQLMGRRSEKVDVDQLTLMLELAGVPKPEPPVELLPKPKPKQTAPAKGHGRKSLPKDLPREVVELEPAAKDKVCESCGTAKVCIGHEVAESLDYVPASLKVIERRRAKYACRACGEGKIVVADVPARPIEKGLADAGLLAHVMVSKYAHHQPLERQCKMLRQQGIELSPSTLVDWVAACAESLEPIATRIGDMALESAVMQADDTGIRCLDQDHPKGSKRGHLWANLGDHRWSYFFYTPNRRAEGPMPYLQRRKGWLVADAYSGFDRLYSAEGATAIEVGCWAHTRRYFHDVVEAGDYRAAIALELIGKLYEVEREAKQAGLDAEQRLALREQRSRPVMDDFFRWVAKTYNEEPPKSGLARALIYAINQSKALMRFLEDGRLPLDNNACEREIRSVAIGRKNYLFVGSDEGGRRAAIMYTLLGTCSLAGVDPWAYLRDVLQRIADGWPQSRLDELLPPNLVPHARA